MKTQNILTLIAILPFFLSAQNAFDKRSVKTPSSNYGFKNKLQVIDASSKQSSLNTRPAANAPIVLIKNIDLHKTESKRRAIINTHHAIEQAYTHLHQTKADIDNDFNINHLIVKESIIDDLGYSHVRFQQQINGVEVFGSELLVHFLENETYTHGQWSDIPSGFNVIPVVSKESAVQASLKSFIPEYGFKILNESDKKILNYEAPETRTVILTENNLLQLCYEIMVRPNLLERWRIRIDATTGKTIETLNLTCHVDGPRTGSGVDLNNVSRTINSYQVGSTYYLIDATRSMFNLSASNMPDDPSGAIWTIDAGNTYVQSFNQVSSGSSNYSNPSAVSAHYNAGFAFEYYKNTFNRNSINGTGGTIISVINVSDENGQGFDNAFWNGSYMAYGNGKTTFKPLAGSLDVAGHEMTHGVVENSASLEYKNQSGAINESMADIFGCMMDRDDWKLGEDIMKPGVSTTGALRDMQDPHNGGNSLSDNFFQPKHMSEFYTGSQDNGGVHINSGIPNHAFYLFASSVTKAKAEQVYYRALTVYLTKTSVFKDLRLAVVQASKDLYGNTEAAAAASAFDAVGIYGDPVGGGNIGNNVDDLLANPGQDYVLYFDLDPNVSFTLTKRTLSSSSSSGQITRNVKRKPSIVDDGQYAVYVGTDNRIYSLLLDGSKTESVMSNETIWDNAAISKDGKRLAAITTEQDSSIYVYDFTLQEWKRFKLYNPTYSNVNSGGVLYADALEWDHTGKKLMYDANNIINNQGGSDYSYWDVGVLEVWDPIVNTWAGGKIEKLFSSLPENISIGNAVYSQKSPYIVAYDYIDAFSGEYYVMSYNLNTNKSGAIFNGSDLGFPCFSRNDDKMIFNAKNTFGEDVIGQITLNSDKISSTGGATILINESKWGVWYSDGIRKLLFDKKDLLSFAFNGLSPAVVATINGTNVTANVPAGTDRTDLIASFTNSAYSTVKKSAIVQTSGVNSNNFTTTQVYTVTAQDGSTKNYNVTVTENVVSLDEIKQEKSMVYPNPNEGIIHIDFNGLIPDIMVYDLSGKLLIKGKPENNRFDISELEAGIYLIGISLDGKTEFIKLIKT